MIQTIIFCHGFGMDGSIFDPLRPYFNDYKIIDWDLGYFGQKRIEFSQTCIGVGHSIGFYKLMEHEDRFKGVISLGGFFDFIVASKKRAKELAALEKLFASSSSNGLAHFYNLIGRPSAAARAICHQTLLCDLDLLQTMKAKTPKIPILAMYAEDDPIVTSAVSHKNFSTCPRHIFQDGGHLFIEKNKEEIASYILSFIGCLNG